MNVLITASDKRMRGYAETMIKSFMEFNPDVEVFHITENPYGIEWRNISIVSSNLVEKFDSMLWMDADALVLEDISDMWAKDGTIRCMQGGNGYALGTWSATWQTAQDLAHRYIRDYKCSSFKNKYDNWDEGTYFRAIADTYYPVRTYPRDWFRCREEVQEMTPEDLPRVIHFNLMADGKRPQSEVVNGWIAQNL